MSKDQLQDILDCQMAKCRFLRRCTMKLGRRCVRQGGKKIPRIASAYNPGIVVESTNRSNLSGEVRTLGGGSSW